MTDIKPDGFMSYVTGPVGGSMMVAAPTRMLALIGHDGSVKIDWTEAERAAAQGPADRGWALAVAFLAIRDGTWKPFA
jgi:hypothetical protein